MLLQVFLVALGILDPGIFEDPECAKYGEKTVVAVKVLQEAVGFMGNDIDGCFGPDTRERVSARIYCVSSVEAGQEFHFDIRQIPLSAFHGETTWFMPGKPDAVLQWPPTISSEGAHTIIPKIIHSHPKVVVVAAGVDNDSEIRCTD